MSVDASKTTCDSLKATVKASNAQMLRLHPSRLEVDIPSDVCITFGRRRRLATVNVK